MRQNISYDSDDYGWSAFWWVFFICLIFCCFFWWPSPTPANESVGWSGWGWSTWGWIILICLCIWWICCLCYVPMYVDVDDDAVSIRRPLKSKKIRMDEIESVEPYKVSGKPSKKFLGAAPVKSFGRWGRYKDDKIGEYFAYYGNSDNTVLITLKDGRKYVVGGSDAKALSDYINNKINKQA